MLGLAHQQAIIVILSSFSQRANLLLFVFGICGNPEDSFDMRELRQISLWLLGFFFQIYVCISSFRFTGNFMNVPVIQLSFVRVRTSEDKVAQIDTSHFYTET